MPAAAAVMTAVFPANRPAIRAAPSRLIRPLFQRRRRASRRHRVAFLARRRRADIAKMGQTGIGEQSCSKRAPGAAFLRPAAIAQLVEHLIRNEGVGGSNPSCGTNGFNYLRCVLAWVPAAGARLSPPCRHALLHSRSFSAECGPLDLSKKMERRVRRTGRDRAKPRSTRRML
jgi:hypothetical protein